MTEAEHAGKPVGELLEDVPAGRHRPRIPGTVAVEDHDVTAVNVTDVVDDLVDQHPVVDLEGVLHRARRDPERLDRVGLDHHREQQGDGHQDRQLAPERALPAGAPPPPAGPGAGRPGGGWRRAALVGLRGVIAVASGLVRRRLRGLGVDVRAGRPSQFRCLFVSPAHADPHPSSTRTVIPLSLAPSGHRQSACMTGPAADRGLVSWGDSGRKTLTGPGGGAA